MKPPSPPHQRHWPRLVALLIIGGVIYLSLQGADLYALQSLARSTEAGVAFGRKLAPAAYVPIAVKPAAPSPDEVGQAETLRLAEVGNGGDLARRARQALSKYQPCLLAQQADDTACVALGPLVEALGGQLQWSEGNPQASVMLPHGLITLQVGATTAQRNYRPVLLTVPPRAQYGQLRVAVKDLAKLLGATVVQKGPETPTQVTLGKKNLYLLVRQSMYHLEASREGRWLQVYFLGQPLKRYPLCTGRGENTPVGHFHIMNKAVWPPWNAYWGEHMPGGSSRNPLGARWLGTSAHGRETGRVIGIHGTNEPSSIGKRISGGCMRTYNQHAIELYNNIPVGTPLDIHE